MKLFNKVVIIGTGLIGGSLGLAIKKNKLVREVIGISRHKESLSLAEKIGAIDKADNDIRVVSNADLVILATPPEVLLKLARQAAEFIKNDCVVFDVASTKEKITKELDRLFPNYIGTHPLAGSEKRGIKYADAAIFQNSTCILTPTENTTALALQKVKTLWLRIGAKVICLSIQSHDKILSFISHLPHIAAFSLVNTVPQGYLRFASSGFKDTTRIAGSDSKLWSEIFLTNQKNILAAIEAYQSNLDRLKSAIENKDKQTLEKLLRRAKNKKVVHCNISC